MIRPDLMDLVSCDSGYGAACRSGDVGGITVSFCVGRVTRHHLSGQCRKKRSVPQLTALTPPAAPPTVPLTRSVPQQHPCQNGSVAGARFATSARRTEVSGHGKARSDRCSDHFPRAHRRDSTRQSASAADAGHHIPGRELAAGTPPRRLTGAQRRTSVAWCSPKAVLGS